MTLDPYFLTVDEVLQIHRTLLLRYGGEAGVSHRGVHEEGVIAIVGAVRNAYYEDLREFAAAYAIYIVFGHIFLDGNKRAAGACMLAFLAKNGHPKRWRRGKLKNLMLTLQRRAERGERMRTLLPWLAKKL